MRFGIAIATALVLTLAGCAGGGRPAREDASAPLPQSGALALIGLWTVEGTDEKPGTVLRIAPKKQLSLWRDCGTLNGSWSGAAGLVIATIYGGSDACFPGRDTTTEATPDWLRKSTGYRPDGTGFVLVDQGGATLARLVSGGKPKVTEGVAPSEAEPPVITDEDRAELGSVAALPAGLTPAEPNLLTGRWVPATGGPAPFVAFQADGAWTGSDGCNGNGGRWVAGSGGAFLATRGPSTLIGCDGADVPTWLSTAVLAGFAADQLVLVNAAGAEVGRLKKS